MNVNGFLVSIVACLYLCAVDSISHLTADDNTTPNIRFVEVIKKDLKHNNDDYKEKAIANKNTGKDEAKQFRRAHRKYSEEYDYGEIPIINTETVLLEYNETNKDNAAQQNESKVAKLNGIMLPTVRPWADGKELLRNKLDVPKFVNKNKVDKFKQFMEKNKDLLKQYMSSKVAQTHTAATVIKASKPDLKKLVRPALLRGALKRKKIQRYGDDEEVLVPEMLDMSPAKGGRVHRQRLKGRLCHRHVLMPEGPKYDSSGKWYLKEHPPSALRPYEVTHRPKLLLPRCCNCCKKSVLGCD